METFGCSSDPKTTQNHFNHLCSLSACPVCLGVLHRPLQLTHCLLQTLDTETCLDHLLLQVISALLDADNLVLVKSNQNF